MGLQRTFLGIVTAVVLVGGCGGGGSHDSMSHGGAAEPTQTVDVTMRDIAYDPPAVTVKAGETVQFVFHNQGQIRHDAFLGDEAAQAEHEKEMRKEGSGGMDDRHSADAITVDPGKTGSLTHTFKAGDALVIGCHELGHYTAGMKLAVTVT
jgi:uncharacterized cupredoxin-like copper-binding protein